MGKTPEKGKPLVWLRGEVKTPPFSHAARLEAGYLLRLLQEGELFGLPHSRPMPVIGPRCHELRITDEGAHFASCIGLMWMPSSFWMCFARRRSKRHDQSLRPANGDFETMMI